MLNPRFEKSFRELVRTWEDHARAAKAGDLRQMAEARAALDAARLDAARSRRIAA